MTKKRIGVVGLPGAWSTELLASAIEERTGFRLVIDLGKVVVELDKGRIRAGDAELTELDALIVKKVDVVYDPNSLDRIEVLRYLESQGVKCFSKPRAIYGLIDRLSCTVSLRAGGIRMPPTVITENVQEACLAVERFGAAVFKPLYSTKARGMAVIKAGMDMRTEVEAFKAAGNRTMYIQQKLDLGDRDYGVTFLGGEHLATYARVKASETWNTTIHSGGHYARHEPSPEMLDLANRAQAIFGLDFTTVDVIDTVDGPAVLEVSAFGGFRGLKEGCGLDAAALYADHVLAQLG
ncbi:MAG: GAK system ATP-grasp enzyme [Myxococcales bacterium]|nr:GAK system ATP-grasp enzyme [Myxococcales bacterium]